MSGTDWRRVTFNQLEREVEDCRQVGKTVTRLALLVALRTNSGMPWLFCQEWVEKFCEEKGLDLPSGAVATEAGRVRDQVRRVHFSHAVFPSHASPGRKDASGQKVALSVEEQVLVALVAPLAWEKQVSAAGSESWVSRLGETTYSIEPAIPDKPHRFLAWVQEEAFAPYPVPFEDEATAKMTCALHAASGVWEL